METILYRRPKMKSHTGWIALVIIAGLSVIGAFIALLTPWAHPDPPTPPLLERVTAAGGYWGACPARNTEQAQIIRSSPLALSPELDQRLGDKFPAGTGETKITDTLREQGFTLPMPCPGDPSIRSAAFTQHGGGILFYPLSAEVFWKVDRVGNIVWTKGFVRYVGL
jgi:hypothetical protein